MSNTCKVSVKAASTSIQDSKTQISYRFFEWIIFRGLPRSETEWWQERAGGSTLQRVRERESEGGVAWSSVEEERPSWLEVAPLSRSLDDLCSCSATLKPLAVPTTNVKRHLCQILPSSELVNSNLIPVNADLVKLKDSRGHLEKLKLKQSL